jgi:hypothetical protein
MPPEGFELTISASEWPKTYALDRAATGTGSFLQYILWTRHITSYRLGDDYLVRDRHISVSTTFSFTTFKTFILISYARIIYVI